MRPVASNVKPSGQEHSKDPAVFVQVAVHPTMPLHEHGLRAHSLSSEITNSANSYNGLYFLRFNYVRTIKDFATSQDIPINLPMHVTLSVSRENAVGQLQRYDPMVLPHCATHPGTPPQLQAWVPVTHSFSSEVISLLTSWMWQMLYI